MVAKVVGGSWFAFRFSGWKFVVTAVFNPLASVKLHGAFWSLSKRQRECGDQRFSSGFWLGVVPVAVLQRGGS